MALLNQLTKTNVTYYFFVVHPPTQTNATFLNNLTKPTTVVISGQYPTSTNVAGFNQASSVSYVLNVASLPTSTNASTSERDHAEFHRLHWFQHDSHQHPGDFVQASPDQEQRPDVLRLALLGLFPVVDLERLKYEENN